MQSWASRISLTGLMVGALALGGCATTGSVKRAQSAADSAAGAAQRAQGSADAAGGAAQSANGAAQRAESTAEAAASAAQLAGIDAHNASDRIDALSKRVDYLMRRRHAGKHKPRRHHAAGAKAANCK